MSNWIELPHVQKVVKHFCTNLLSNSCFVEPKFFVGCYNFSTFEIQNNIQYKNFWDSLMHTALCVNYCENRNFKFAALHQGLVFIVVKLLIQMNIQHEIVELETDPGRDILCSIKKSLYKQIFTL